MIKPNDSERLARHFPDADWGQLFWGFTCCSRMKYAGDVPLESEINLGIQAPEGGFLCELTIRWYPLHNRMAPRLTAFSEAWPLICTPTIQTVLDLVSRLENPYMTPDEMSMLLTVCGFIDRSDLPLRKTAAVEETASM